MKRRRGVVAGVVAVFGSLIVAADAAVEVMSRSPLILLDADQYPPVAVTCALGHRRHEPRDVRRL